jgi:hypothetical protein
MNIINFKIDNRILDNNLIEFANTIKTLIFRYDEALFELIDIDNDKIFLEPTIFYYFLNRELSPKHISLYQYLWGYIVSEKKPKKIDVSSDNYGIINIPNYGYFSYQPNQTIALCWDKNSKSAYFQHHGKRVEPMAINNLFLNDSKIKICQHAPEFLTKIGGVNYLESPRETINDSLGTLNNAWGLLRKIVPDFCYYVEKTTREISLFKSLHQESRASFSYYGTAFINTNGNEIDEIFFIDDIAHQSGHVLFYPLSLPASDYLKPAKRTLLRKYTEVDWEPRDIYGCFHGLFTYTTIIYCFDKCIDSKCFNSEMKHHALARIGFYMDKFRKDIANMNDMRILTDCGYDYFDMFRASYNFIYEKYKLKLRKMNFENQNYYFDYNLFLKTNPIKIFI